MLSCIACLQSTHIPIGCDLCQIRKLQKYAHATYQSQNMVCVHVTKVLMHHQAATQCPIFMEKQYNNKCMHEWLHIRVCLTEIIFKFIQLYSRSSSKASNSLLRWRDDRFVRTGKFTGSYKTMVTPPGE